MNSENFRATSESTTGTSVESSDADLAGSTVFVVDDDASIRRMVAAILNGAGIQFELCDTGGQFLSKVGLEHRGCLLLDVEMPGMNGPQVQKALTERQIFLPIVFLTGTVDVATSVDVMRHGAVDLIQKPFDKTKLLEVVRSAMRLDLRNARVRHRQMAARDRFNTLNQREREVMGFVVAGLANKQVARKLELSEKTIEVHRARVMQKMGADSLADLVRYALDAGVGSEAGSS